MTTLSINLSKATALPICPDAIGQLAILSRIPTSFPLFPAIQSAIQTTSITPMPIAGQRAYRQPETARPKSLTEVDDALRDKIIRYPTRFASDVEFFALLFFIDEVFKNKETTNAVRGGRVPMTNSLHSYTGFGDIQDV